MKHATRARAARMVVLIGMPGAALAFGQDSDPCYEAYLQSGLTARQMGFGEFRAFYDDTVCARSAS